MKTLPVLAGLLSLPVLLASQSNLFIDTSYTAEQMVMDFFDNPLVTPYNITFKRGPVSMAFFEGANTDLGLPAGIVLSSGDVTHLADSVGYFASTAFMTPGDPALTLLGGFQTFDAALLEFDLEVQEDTLDFTYVFGSEEYPEWVGSSFNDVFAFFLSGPGIADTINIAMVPDSPDPVAINTVNFMSNTQYFVDNEVLGSSDIALDGFTTPLPATGVFIPGETYHVKIGVTDVGDGVFDSGVFISVGSLGGSDSLLPPAIFELVVDGNAVSLTNESRYATSWYWNFGDGVTTNERHPDPHVYAEAGLYTVTLITQNYCCSDTFQVEVQVGVVGTEEALVKPFRLQPNPVDDLLHIQLMLTDRFEYALTDLNGRQIGQGELHGSQTLQLGALEPGLYLLSLWNDERVYTEKLWVR